MRHASYLIAGVVLVAGLGLATITRASESSKDAGHAPAAAVEAIEGTELHRLTLSEKAAERIGIQTSPVLDQQVGGADQKTIPYSAVIYDEHGNTWAYTTKEPLVFVRDQISVDHIAGDTAYLSDGPAAGTEVVTVGSAELVGTERYGH
jgi:hypothetical protein